MTCPSGKRCAGYKEAVKERDREQQRTGGKLYVYRCRHCERFHLSSKAPVEAVA